MSQHVDVDISPCFMRKILTKGYLFYIKRKLGPNQILYGSSVCGPLLFLLYIDDLPDILINSQVSLYADDTVIYTSISGVDQACNVLQQDLNLLQNWCEMNKLTINCKKKKKICVCLGCGQLLKRVKPKN